MRRASIFLLALVLAAGCAAPAGESLQAVRIAVQDGGNLQWMSFWVALGAGFFEEAGLPFAVEVTPVAEALLSGAADIAITPRPEFLTMVGEARPVVAFANLLANDPINLVVREAVAVERGVRPEMSLGDRLRRLEGLKVGIAPGPPPRLRALLQSAGLEPGHFEIVTIGGNRQNAAFAGGEVDALYAHTPFLERAIVTQNAILVANQSAGEVPELSGREIHLMTATRSYAASHREVLVAVAGALGRAQELIHSDPEATRRAILNSGARIEEPTGLETIVGLYRPAVPRTPDVSTRVGQEITFFPEHRPLPDLTGIELADYVDNGFVEEARSRPTP